MGGHAVRYYGLDRNTNDFDLHLAPENWANLTELLQHTPLFAGQPLIEGPTWRPGVFRRWLNWVVFAVPTTHRPQDAGEMHTA